MISALLAQFRQREGPTVNINDFTSLFSCNIVLFFNMAAESVQVADEDNISIFKELESYPWESDAEFQVGTRQPRQFTPHIF
jgi:hypothetical protein